jgi:hypothetical chaperone protein
MSHFCGIDFGTSNSVITVVDEAGNTVFRKFAPSILYFPEDKESAAERYCGEEAVQKYLDNGMTGRFFQSVKAILPDPDFHFTVINRKSFSVNDLVAVLLRYLLKEANDALRKTGLPEITQAVIGRPAFFSDKKSEDELAEERLESAARQAGLSEVVFQKEPIAAAFSYEQSLDNEQTVMVSDIGGGTSDFTVMNLRPFKQLSTSDRTADILAFYGVHYGGDDFDGKLMWHEVTELLGRGTYYESWGKRLPVPIHLFHTICKWDQIHFLKTMKYRDELKYFRAGAEDRPAIERLAAFIERDLGYSLFREIEKCKIELSSRDTSHLEFHDEMLDFKRVVSRYLFEEYIAELVAEIKKGMEAALGLAEYGKVDTVFLTGGSSRVPIMRSVFEKAGTRIILDNEQFMSISKGLALYARELGLELS